MGPSASPDPASPVSPDLGRSYVAWYVPVCWIHVYHVSPSPPESRFRLNFKSTSLFLPPLPPTMASPDPQIHEISSEPLGDAHLTRASFAHLDEKAILRKMDTRLIPMLALLYLLSFLDRGNIGNARIEGLVDDLGMTGPQYNWTC